MIGRSRGEATADRRKDELNGYVWHLIHAAPEVTQVGPDEVMSHDSHTYRQGGGGARWTIRVD